MQRQKYFGEEWYLKAPPKILLLATASTIRRADLHTFGIILTMMIFRKAGAD